MKKFIGLLVAVLCMVAVNVTPLDVGAAETDIGFDVTQDISYVTTQDVVANTSDGLYQNIKTIKEKPVIILGISIEELFSVEVKEQLKLCSLNDLGLNNYTITTLPKPKERQYRWY